MAAGGTPANVHLGPGRLYKAPLGTTEPASASAALPSAWVAIGYTEDGTEIVTDITAEDVEVAEELDPIDTVQVRRVTTVNVQPAEMTVNNLATSLGGEVTRTNDAVAYEFPDPEDIVAFMLVWDSNEDPTSDSGATNRRWVFRSVKPAGTVTTARRKAPQKALLPMALRANKPASGAAAIKVYPNANGRV
jgi:hypothetical protein